MKAFVYLPSQRFWKSHPYLNVHTGLYCAGKIHVMNETEDRTLCGKSIRDFQGDVLQLESGSSSADCKTCVRIAEAKKSPKTGTETKWTL